MTLEQKIKLAKMDPALVADEIGNFIIDNVLRFNKNGVVIGLSGGVDSTCVAAITKKAFDKYNILHQDKPLELVGYILPSNTNDPKDAEDGIEVAERLGIRYEVKAIEDVVDAFRDLIPKLKENTQKSNYDAGNMKSEIRAVFLHTKAAVEGKSVVGTGNKDEDYGLGYYTLFGDGAVHMSPIGNLPKRLVREMTAYLGFKDLAYRVSTPGLEPGQTSFKDLGYDYEFAEIVIEGIDQGIKPDGLAKHNQIVQYVKEQTEKYIQLYGKAKFSEPSEFIADIMKRHELALAKGKLVCPDVAKITLQYD
jgi:NAD+ synthase